MLPVSKAEEGRPQMENPLAGPLIHESASDPTQGTRLVDIRDLRVMFGLEDPFVAVDNVSLSIQEGRFTCFIGPSGCGKSTVLNCIAGLIEPAKGGVWYGGTKVEGPNTACGYMTQGDTLLPWLTVAANVEIGLKIRKVPKKDRDRRVTDVLASVELSKFGERYPSQLSGGMRRRAVLARTLVYDPDTILMDEPFAALDAQLRLKQQEDLLRLWERDRRTIVFVTHDLDEALALADDIVVFGGQPGHVVHRQIVDLPRPRRIGALRQDPRFWDLWNLLWSQMESARTPDRREFR